jgi:predicted RNA binding protein with dsRBD fold (UPF0201 family)
VLTGGLAQQEKKTEQPKLSIEVILRTEVKPSEDKFRIETAMTRLFPGTSVRNSQSLDKKRVLFLQASGTNSLTTFKEQLKARRTRAAARRLLERNKRGERTTWVYLNKQALVSGTVALCERPDESPLGPVVLEITSEQLNSVIEWLTLGAALSPETEPR